MSQIMESYLLRYPQLSLPIQTGMSISREYLDIVRRGRLPRCLDNPFQGSERDETLTVETPVGPVTVLHLGCRADFVRFVQVMCYRCEPKQVPASMGAVSLFHVTNWRKILAHRTAYLLQGHTDWAEEFKRFTACPERYQDTVLVVSDGPYSALPASEAGRTEAEWREESLTIRIWHELAHLVSRQRWPENIHPLRDELVADGIGLLAAYGRYDPALAAAVLGITPQGYRPGGRLENYLSSGADLDAVLDQSRRMLELLVSYCGPGSCALPFSVLEALERDRVGCDIWNG